MDKNSPFEMVYCFWLINVEMSGWFIDNGIRDSSLGNLWQRNKINRIYPK